MNRAIGIDGQRSFQLLLHQQENGLFQLGSIERHMMAAEGFICLGMAAYIAHSFLRYAGQRMAAAAAENVCRRVPPQVSGRPQLELHFACAVIAPGVPRRVKGCVDRSGSFSRITS